MNHRIIVRSAIAAVAAAAALAALASPAAAEAPAPTQRQARFEVDFMSDTIEHHFLAIQMGELCVSKTTAPPPSSDETLRSTCEEIVAAQTEEMQLLQSWLADWYGIDKEPELPPGGEQMLEMLSEAQGEEFDIMVSRMFIRHHWTFLPKADQCTETAFHDQLRDLCQQMYTTQRSQVETFKAILNDHGLNRRGPNGNPGGR